MSTSSAAIVPVKRLEHAKSRLAERLTAADRRELVIQLFEHVLTALNGARLISQNFVVTSDPDIVNAAQRGGANVLHQADTGIKTAIECGIDAATRTPVEALAVVLADLPFLTAADLDAMIGMVEPGVISLAPDRRSCGTNALVYHHTDVIEPGFGACSFDAHRTMAQKQGLKIREYRSLGTAFDLDVPGDLEDYERLRSDRRSTQTDS